jgi:hypothetical protein
VEDAGVVHEHVDGALGREDAVDRRRDAVLLAHVELERARLSAGLLDARDHLRRFLCTEAIAHP